MKENNGRMVIDGRCFQKPAAFTGSITFKDGKWAWSSKRKTGNFIPGMILEIVDYHDRTAKIRLKGSNGIIIMSSDFYPRVEDARVMAKKLSGRLGIRVIEREFGHKADRWRRK